MNIGKIFGKIEDNLWNDWRWQLANRITDPKAIGIKDNAIRFAITPHYLSLIKRPDSSDPLYMQIASDLSCDLMKKDPFDEKSHMPIEGLIVRYPDRGLVVATNFCYAYCQFCTRKWRWDEPEQQLDIARFKKIAAYLENHTRIRELIFSGGEVLSLADKTIEAMLSVANSVRNIKTIRIATRALTFMPQRITDKFAQIMKNYAPIWIMTHFNHPRELSKQSLKAIEKLRFSGAVLLNQSVLLKGVNDDYDTLYTLFSRLQEAGIKPYYLFSCDPVYGTERFKVPIEQGIELIERLLKELGGIAVPRYVADVPNRSKLHIAPLQQIS